MIAALARLLGTTEQNAIDAAKSERGYRAAVSRRSFLAAGSALASGSVFGFGSMLAPVADVGCLLFAATVLPDGTHLTFLSHHRVGAYETGGSLNLPQHLVPAMAYYVVVGNPGYAGCVRVRDGRARIELVPKGSP